MRTTVTLDPDVEAIVRTAMRERGLSFKQALNDAIRRGVAPRQTAKFRTPTFDMGEPLVPLTKALALAGELEDEEIVRKLAVGKSGHVFVVDANVLLHATNTASAQHRVARGWLDGALSGDEPVGFAWIAVLAFLRLSTRAGVFPTPLSAMQSLDVVEAWLAQPVAMITEPTRRHFAVLRGLVEQAGTAGNLTTDAHLATLAVEHGAELVSFDRDFQRYPGVRLTLLASS